MKLNKTETLLMDRIAFCAMEEKTLGWCFTHREVLAGISLEQKGLVRFENRGYRIDGVNQPGAVIYPAA